MKLALPKEGSHVPLMVSCHLLWRVSVRVDQKCDLGCSHLVGSLDSFPAYQYSQRCHPSWLPHKSKIALQTRYESTSSRLNTTERRHSIPLLPSALLAFSRQQPWAPEKRRLLQLSQKGPSFPEPLAQLSGDTWCLLLQLQEQYIKDSRQKIRLLIKIASPQRQFKKRKCKWQPIFTPRRFFSLLISTIFLPLNQEEKYHHKADKICEEPGKWWDPHSQLLHFVRC